MPICRRHGRSKSPPRPPRSGRGSCRWARVVEASTRTSGSRTCSGHRFAISIASNPICRSFTPATTFGSPRSSISVGSGAVLSGRGGPAGERAHITAGTPDRRIEQLELRPASRRGRTDTSSRPRSLIDPRSPRERFFRWIELLLLEPGYFVMERGMLREFEQGRPRLMALGASGMVVGAMISRPMTEGRIRTPRGEWLTFRYGRRGQWPGLVVIQMHGHEH